MYGIVFTRDPAKSELYLQNIYTYLRTNFLILKKKNLRLDGKENMVRK